jgi:hypothetical protein
MSLQRQLADVRAQPARTAGGGARWGGCCTRSAPARRDCRAHAGEDIAWLGSRFAAGEEQRAQELCMVSMKERLAADAEAQFAGAVRVAVWRALHSCN